MWLLWMPVGLVLAIGYIVTYVLLRTSGDGRSAVQRLIHPRGDGLQEEYGGLGNGRRPPPS